MEERRAVYTENGGDSGMGLGGDGSESFIPIITGDFDGAEASHLPSSRRAELREVSCLGK